MNKIKYVDYIEDNHCFTWTIDSFLEYGQKGVAANDIGVDYDQIIKIERIRDFWDGNVIIRSYLVKVNIRDEEIPYLMKIHIYDDRPFRIYYMHL